MASPIHTPAYRSVPTRRRATQDHPFEGTRNLIVKVQGQSDRPNGPASDYVPLATHSPIRASPRRSAGERSEYDERISPLRSDYGRGEVATTVETGGRVPCAAAHGQDVYDGRVFSQQWKEIH